MLKPDEYVKLRVHEYPISYCKKDFERSALRIFDQLFNVIGNGIRDDIELHVELNGKLDNTVDYNRYFSKEPLYTGYTKLDERMTELMSNLKTTIPGGEDSPVIAEMASHVYKDYNSRIEGAYLEHEKINRPDVLVWEEIGLPNPAHRWSPYPNFQEDYSIIYRSDFKSLGVEWIDAATWFYKECKTYFAGDCSNYHNAYPTGTPEQDAKLNLDMENMLKQYDSNEEISEAYGVLYDGDIDAFQRRRWTTSLSEINLFIDNTLEYLGSMRNELTAEIESTPSPN